MQTQKPKMTRSVEYMVFISILSISTALAGCPSKCSCFKNAVNCSGKSLMNIPNFQRLENDPSVIDLSSNEIDFIQYDDLSFDKAEVVEFLFLNNSKIIDVDDTAFKELINVKEINLSDNLLGELPPNSFFYNTKLVLLDLSHNLFRIMPKLVSTSLEILLLANSGIEKIENDSFAQIQRLKYLNLQRNHIKMIDTKMFKYLPKLRLIQLEFNRWKCTCESVELFNYLQENSVLDIEKPVQCRINADVFVTFFTENGTPEPVEDLCAKNRNDPAYNFVGNYLEPKEIFNQRRSAKTHHKISKDDKKEDKFNTQGRKNETKHVITYDSKKGPNKTKTPQNSNFKCEKLEYASSFTVSNYLIFFIAVILAYIVGLASGCLFVGSTSTKRKENSCSCDSLLVGPVSV